MSRLNEAEGFLNEALSIANRVGALGYQAQLTMKQAELANLRKQPEESLALLDRAAALARQAGGSRILAEIELETAKIDRVLNRQAAAESSRDCRVAGRRRHLLLFVTWRAADFKT
jgi:hypothetical protein